MWFLTKDWNGAESPIIAQKALTEGLAAGQIAGAGLDVFADEPPAADDPLMKLDNVIVTPHALAFTHQAFAAIGAADIAAVLDVMRGHGPASIVNQGILTNARWRAKLDAYRTIFGSR